MGVYEDLNSRLDEYSTFVKTQQGVRLKRAYSDKEGVEMNIEVYITLERKLRELFPIIRGDLDEQVLALPVKILGVGARTRNLFLHEKIRTLGDVLCKSESEYLKYRNFGPGSLEELKEELLLKGLELKK